MIKKEKTERDTHRQTETDKKQKRNIQVTDTARMRETETDREKHRQIYKCDFFKSIYRRLKPATPA